MAKMVLIFFIQLLLFSYSSNYLVISILSFGRHVHCPQDMGAGFGSKYNETRIRAKKPVYPATWPPQLEFENLAKLWNLTANKQPMLFLLQEKQE
jgi:hypothetical protein